MNVNFVKEFGKNKYVIIDPNNDSQIKKIGDFSSASTFYIFNPSTNRTKKLTNPQFKELFSSNAKELENLLNIIIKRNVENERIKISEEFEEIVVDTFNNEINKINFLNYIGKFLAMKDVPLPLKVGDVFEIDNGLTTEHYIVLSDSNILRWYTKDEIDSLLSNYYKNSYVDELINKLKTSTSEQKIKFENDLELIKSKTSNYITYSEFLNLKLKYKNDVDNFKNEIDENYLKQINDIKLNAIEQLSLIKNDVENKISILENKYDEYNANISNELNEFKELTIASYDAKILELNNQVLDLTTKINELEKILDDLLNED